MNDQRPSRLPRRALFASIGVTVVSALAALAIGLSSGWTPRRESAGVVLPVYFAVLLTVLTVSFVISGNTLMHHHRTGTVQRATDPVLFWRIVTIQSVIAGLLFFFGLVSWSNLNG